MKQLLFAVIASELKMWIHKSNKLKITIQPLSPTVCRLYGNLTTKDTTLPVTLFVELLSKHESPITHKTTAGFRLKGIVNRTDYKLGPGYLPSTIANDVHIIVDGEFAKD